MKKITYLFIKGRKENIEENTIEAEEFYYGSLFLKSKGLEVEIIEFDDNLNKNNIFLKGVDKILSKYCSLPFYTSKVTSIKNLKVLLKTTDLFLISESTGFSILPLLIITKLFSKVNVNLFVMGLYSKHLKYPRLRFLHKLLIKVLNYYVDNLLFLGKGELNKAIKNDVKNNQKFTYFPWSVDDDFWRLEQKPLLKNKDKIIFVGNDGNRDEKLLVELAKKLPEYKFIFVTNISNLVNLKMDNVEIIQGQWGESYLTDTELKQIYSSARLSIIPLKKSSQPSGQSVALQSMSLGIPVIISDTEGFWDRESFIDKKHIIMVDSNNYEEWIDHIKDAYNDIEQLNLISNNALELTKSKFSKTMFNKKILELIKDQN